MIATVRRRRATAGVLATAAWLGVAGACGVPGSSSFRRTDNDKIPFGLANTTTTTTTVPSTTTTTIVEIFPSTTLERPPDIATVPLYFVAGKQLVLISKTVLAPASLVQVLLVLEDGPPADETAIGVRTAIPTGAASTARQERGVVTIDLPLDFFEGMSTADQRLAVAQYVLTLTELSGIGLATFTQNGSPIAVLGGGGELTEAGQLMAHEDYEGLLQAGAPEVTAPSSVPATSTTTATSAP